jgi:D-3-phosphoglycerate dehydrogenase
VQAHDPVAIIVRYGKVGGRVMDAAPSLKVISKHGSGTDTIDKDAAKARGIEVRAAAGANAAAVAEQALALLLACAKSVTQLNERMHAGHWDKATHKSVELHGRTIGLVGSVRSASALRACATRWACACSASTRSRRTLPDFIRTVDLETIWRESDAISLHCPLTPENRDLLDARTLQACKRGVMLVNTARGGLIDEAALLQRCAAARSRRRAWTVLRWSRWRRRIPSTARPTSSSARTSAA